MFTADVATNLAGPLDTADAGFDETVELIVSVVLAVA
jgi:hypothetical protein